MKLNIFNFCNVFDVPLKDQSRELWAEMDPYDWHPAATRNHLLWACADRALLRHYW